jgi:hypothetical protein
MPRFWKACIIDHFIICSIFFSLHAHMQCPVVSPDTVNIAQCWPINIEQKLAAISKQTVLSNIPIRIRSAIAAGLPALRVFFEKGLPLACLRSSIHPGSLIAGALTGIAAAVFQNGPASMTRD